VSLDPNLAYEESSILADLQMYSTLVKFPAGNLTQVRPSVATSWEVSKDILTYTFHLKSGLQFSDGTKLDANDVAYSIDRSLSPAINNQSGFLESVVWTAWMTLSNVRIEQFLPLLGDARQPLVPRHHDGAVRALGDG